MPKIIVIRGPLGVGKTTIAKILAQKLNARYLSLDKILDDNKLSAPDGIPVENFLKANKIIFDLIDKNGDNFIIDGCFYYQEQIDDLKNKFSDKIIFFTLVSDVEKCIERDAEREKIYGEDSARYVHMITTKIKVGYEIDNNNLTAMETVDKIMEYLKK